MSDPSPRCDVEVQLARSTWRKCGKPASWWHEENNWFVCDDHSRHSGGNRAGQVMDVLTALPKPVPEETFDMADIWNAYGCGARDLRLNPTATLAQIERACDGYVKMLLQERAAHPQEGSPTDG